MSAEAIAKVIRDFKRGSVTLVQAALRDSPVEETVIGTVAATLDKAVIVDVTSVYKDFIADEHDKGYMLYEDTVCRPPWWYFVMGFENKHGNVHLMVSVGVDRESDEVANRSDGRKPWRDFEGLRWNTENITDWSQVRWVIWTTFWLGGRAESNTITIPTIGPFLNVYTAINEDGIPLDIHWVAESADDVEQFQAPLAVMMKALTVLNCRNVEVMEPLHRPKPERKRIARLGVTVGEIHVTRIGKYRRHSGPQRLGEGVPLSTVRGHISRYGEKYGRGKLFGKYEGEFWIPGHLRGSADVGETKHEYVVEET